MKSYLVISCEHASNHIPVKYQILFDSQQDVLASHEGYDIAALDLAKRLAEQADYAQFASASRLLVELNRSIGHPKLFSRFTKPLAKREQRAILQQFYFPYRDHLEKVIQQAVANKLRVIHLAVHSFTPELAGQIRRCDIGLLYDSRRQQEKSFCQNWRKLLGNGSELIVRMNYPYSGSADGFTTYLRKRHPEQHYLGIELEVNQRFPIAEPDNWLLVQQRISASVKEMLAHQL